MNKKEDKVITEDDEIVTSFCRLFVLFMYVVKGSTTFSIDDIVSFSKLFSIISLKVTNEDLIERVGKDNFISKTRNFFKENKKFNCLVLKDEYISTISMPETDNDFINIRKNLFNFYYESFCNKEALLKMGKTFRFTNDALEDDDVNNNEQNTDLVQ